MTSMFRQSGQTERPHTFLHSLCEWPELPCTLAHRVWSRSRASQVRQTTAQNLRNKPKGGQTAADPPHSSAWDTPFGLIIQTQRRHYVTEWRARTATPGHSFFLMSLWAMWRLAVSANTVPSKIERVAIWNMPGRRVWCHHANVPHGWKMEGSKSKTHSSEGSTALITTDILTL